MYLKAENAIDENADSFAHTKWGRNHWWKARFEKGARVVESVKITNRRDCCGDRLKYTKVYIGDKLCGTLPAYTETKGVYTVDCRTNNNGKGIAGNTVVIRQDKFTTALQLATVEVFGLDNCMIDEKLTGHKCKRGGDITCSGARTCSRWGWCQGESKCVNTIPEVVEVKQYQATLINNGKKCVDAEDNFADKELESISEDRCAELTFANGGTYFQYNAAFGGRAACQICMLDTEGEPYGYETAQGWKVSRLQPNFPTTVRSWDGGQCVFKCAKNKYLDEATQ
jgi:hypothetical protein